MEIQQNPMPYHSIGEWMKTTFGGKVVKLSIDGGFTCPNRDGTRGTGGCLFCSAGGSGELAGSIPEQIALLHGKWPKVRGYLAYFQSHTNTYAPVSKLRDLWDEALSHPNVMGLAIATRPDCLPEEVLDLLEEYNAKTFLWVELGLQTIHDSTGEAMNRCFSSDEYREAVIKLNKRGIPVVTHLILGLPGESAQDMLESVQEVCKPIDGRIPVFGLKLHLLNIVKTAPMSKTHPDAVPFNSISEYISLVVELLQYVPWEVTIHRLTGDVPRKLLIAPFWSYKKRTIQNGILAEMKARKIKQGCKASLHP